MSPRRTAAATAAKQGASVERELLARLGLTNDANAQDIEHAHDEVVAFLERAPRELRAWAAREIQGADEAYAFLCDPTADVPAVAAVVVAAEPPVSQADDFDDAISDDPELTPAPRPNQLKARRSAAQAPGKGRSRLSPARRLLLAGVAGVAIAAVGFTVYAAGAPAVPGVSGTPAPEASPGSQLDTARVNDLMQKIAADPKDIASLQSLGDLYFNAGQYDVAADWEKKVLAIEPKNATALLALGAADFNQGDSANAEQQWRAVLAVDPKNLEAHYDLGFMYFSAEPPDVAKTTQEWQAVIDIAPDSDVAKTVSTHLATLKGASASGAPAGSPVAAPSSAQPSAAPAGTPAPAAAVPGAQPTAVPASPATPAPATTAP
jgi:cytochrome c-type biogenesis protein CcmH/NrfG